MSKGFNRGDRVRVRGQDYWGRVTWTHDVWSGVEHPHKGPVAAGRHNRGRSVAYPNSQLEHLD